MWRELRNPLKLIALLWPEVRLYDKQREIIMSVHENDKTVVHAGNMLGKDFVSALAVLTFFLTRTPCRIVTTSVDASQLHAVLWGEMRRFLQTSAYPLYAEQGGPLLVNHGHIRRIINNDICGLSYILARVAARGEGMLGHHIARRNDGIRRTLYVADEASGVDDLSNERAESWAHGMLYIGNPYPCANDFNRCVKKGSTWAPDKTYKYVNVIRIRAEDSPNVKRGLRMKELGLKPDNHMVLEGVLSYNEYVKRRSTWSPIRQCIGLDGMFWEGAEDLLFPPAWLARAEKPEFKQMCQRAPAETMGVDPAEGGDDTAWAIGNRFGVKDLITEKTPDTNIIPAKTIELMRKFKLDPRNVYFDRGGGKQHADRLRAKGFDVQTVAFGSAVQAQLKTGKKFIKERRDVLELKYTYKNMRARLYGQLSERLDPSGDFAFGFSIPAEYAELHRQLAPIPRLLDDDGRLYMLKKRSSDPDEKTLTSIIGRSPDDADAVVLMVHGLKGAVRRRIGVM